MFWTGPLKRLYSRARQRLFWGVQREGLINFAAERLIPYPANPASRQHATSVNDAIVTERGGIASPIFHAIQDPDGMAELSPCCEGLSQNGIIAGVLHRNNVWMTKDFRNLGEREGNAGDSRNLVVGARNCGRVTKI